RRGPSAVLYALLGRRRRDEARPGAEDGVGLHEGAYIRPVRTADAPSIAVPNGPAAALAGAFTLGCLVAAPARIAAQVVTSPTDSAADRTVSQYEGGKRAVLPVHSLA